MSPLKISAGLDHRKKQAQSGLPSSDAKKRHPYPSRAGEKPTLFFRCRALYCYELTAISYELNKEAMTVSERRYLKRNSIPPRRDQIFGVYCYELMEIFFFLCKRQIFDHMLISK